MFPLPPGLEDVMLLVREIEPLVQGYHDLVDHGRREIYKVEG